MRFTNTAVTAIAVLTATACVQETGGPIDPALLVASADDAPEVYSTPQQTYRIEKVTPLLATDADLGWFVPGAGSPRDLGAYVGASVIDGLQGAFTGVEGTEMEVVIRQFRPAASATTAKESETHRVKVDFILKRASNGEVLGRSDDLFMDLIALSGPAALIARNAGRSPEVRLAERISRISTAWSAEQTCETLMCPGTAAVASPALAPAALADAQATEAVTPVTDTPVTNTPAEPETVVAEAPAPAPRPAEAEAPPAEAEPAAVEVAEAEPDLTLETFFGRLFASAEEDEASDPAEVETTEAAAAPEPPAASEPPAAPEPVESAPAPIEEPAPATPPATAAAPPEPAPESAPAAPSRVTVAQSTPPGDSSSPFFRSPTASPPALPQVALLGRSQRNNDPLRRKSTDVVLEVSNLPAFWDGDETTGGVWVALPYLPAYRRAVVTNPVNGATVEANLFWRDPQAGGGSTLLSSAAAQALGVAPGQVANLGVKILAAD